MPKLTKQEWVRKFHWPLKFEIFNDVLSHDELKNEDVEVIAPDCD